MAVAAVTVAELLVGVELATVRHRGRRAAFVDGLLETVTIEEYGLDAARAHASLLAWTRREGTSRGAHDLIIAATARSSDRILITADEHGFRDLPGLRLRTTS